MAAAAVLHEENAELQIYAVDEYYIKSSRGKPVCFSTLPLRFGDADVPQGHKALYLWGCTNGRWLQKKVVAWRLELDGQQPQFLVLERADGGGWLRLAKASRIYERTARTVLITAQALHFLRRNPDGPETALWIHLGQVFGYFSNATRLFLLLASRQAALQIGLVLLQQFSD
jgi:hypothetical protein